LRNYSLTLISVCNINAAALNRAGICRLERNGRDVFAGVDLLTVVGGDAAGLLSCRCTWL